MAISGNSVFEIRSTATAANANGGFFVTGATGTDFSQQDAAQYNLTTASTAAADAILLDASAAANMVGNGAHIISGTNFIAGWYEILSVVVGVSITLDRTCTTAAGALGVVNIGGALSLGSADDAVFELPPTSGGVKYWIKGGSAITYTIGGTIAISAGAIGAIQKPHVIEGYNATRGDKPTGATRPTLNLGSGNLTLANNWDVYNCMFVSTGTNGVATGSNNKLFYCKFQNISTTAARNALNSGTDVFIYFCEMISQRGNALTHTSGTVLGCYLHSSDGGTQTITAGATMIFFKNIISSVFSSGIINNGGNVSHSLIEGNTIYDPDQMAYGIDMETGNTDIRVINNIVMGFFVGLYHADVGQTVGFNDYNAFFNNTTNYENFTAGPNDIVANPTFTNVVVVTTATGTTSGSVYTDANANFSSVTDNVDYLKIKSGTGVTTGHYLITSHTATTLTLNIAPGTNATADKVGSIVTGHNFAVGTTMKALAVPGPFPGGFSTGYMDIGAVQRIEPAAGAAAASTSIPKYRL